MRGVYLISLDVHSSSCQCCVASPGGRVLREEAVATTIPALRELIESVRRPRHLIMEEGPLADWLFRSLNELCDQMTICDPRRNALVSKDGDKDDPLDARKLIQLLRAGCLRAVHHSQSEAMAHLKSHVQFYHGLVRRRVAAGHRLIWHVRRYGIVITHAALRTPESCRQWMSQLPRSGTVRGQAKLRLAEYRQLQRHTLAARRHLARLARREPTIVRWQALPGIKWVRGATLLATLDAPFRFRKKSALWKYLGIGLERKRSGNGPVLLGVPRHCNRVLKSTILGAAKSAIAASDNPFAAQYERLVTDGLTPDNARRTVARALATTLWGMWKSHSDYRADRVGVPWPPSSGSSSAPGTPR